jgi:hypothetical protein
MRGTNIKVWAIDTVDVNDALDGIVGDAKIGIVVPLGSFTSQIASIYTQAISAGTPVVAIDYASGILDPTGGTTLPAVTFTGRTLRQMIQDRCNALQTINTALRMKFHIGPDTNPNRTTFGGPILYTYDAVASAPFIALWFTDTPTAGKISIAQAVEFGRIVEGAKLIQKRQVLVKATGGIFTGASDAGVITTYKYPYSGDGARWGELVEDSQSLTDAAGQTAITRAVRSTGTPRETIQLSAYAYALPGQYAKLDWALEGLAGAIYAIAAVSVDFRQWRNPLTTFTLGARRLMLGENPDLDELVMPIERDTIPPAMPINWRASPASTYNPVTRMSTVFLAFDGPQETDLQQVEVNVTISGVTQPLTILARGILTLSVVMAPSASWTAFASARDTSGNKSGPTATLSGTAAAWVAEIPGPPATVTLTGLRTGPATWQANVSWSVGTGGTGTAASYEVRYYPTASGASAAIIRPVPNDNRTFIISDLAIAVPYTINVRSVTVNQERGGWSTGSSITFARDTPATPTGLNVITYDPGQTGQSAWILFGWTAGVGGSGTVATWNIRVDWTETSTGIVRKLYFNAIPAANLSAILAPLTAGPSYTITLWGITVYGDSSAAASMTYAIASVPGSNPYNLDFEIADLSDKTVPDGWTISGTGANNLSWGLAIDQFYSGTRSFKSTAKASGTATLILTSRRFAVLVGSNYYFALALRRNAGTSGSRATVGVTFYNSVGGAVIGGFGGFIASAFLANVWAVTKTVGSAAVPPTAVTAEIVITITSEASTSVWIDGFDFRIAPGATDVASGIIDDPTKFGAGMAAIQQGGSNPASPASGDRNWRTDISHDSYYDGTQWSTPDVKILPFAGSAALTAITVSNTTIGRLNHNGDLDWLLYRFAASVFVAGTNNISNYWTLTVRYITAGNTVTAVTTVTTAAVAVNTWARIATTTFSPATAPATAFMIEVIATTTGAPGSLLVAPELMIREILP